MIAAGYLLRRIPKTVATRNSLSRHKIAIATCTGPKAPLGALARILHEGSWMLA